MTDAPFHYIDAETGTEFVWHGGEYIDIGRTAAVDTGPFNDRGEPSYRAGDFIAVDVMNVWNPSTDAPRIDRTRAAFEARCLEYLEDNR